MTDELNPAIKDILTSQIKDTLLKAAEDVQQGLWCTGSWFKVDEEDSPYENLGPDEIYNEADSHPEVSLSIGDLSIDKLSKMQRCAEGSIFLSAYIMKGNYLEGNDLGVATVRAVSQALPNHCPKCREMIDVNVSLNNHNDAHLDSRDRFGSGQHLAELFRSTAESL